MLKASQIFTAARDLERILKIDGPNCSKDGWTYEPPPDDFERLSLEAIVDHILSCEAEYQRLTKQLNDESAENSEDDDFADFKAEDRENAVKEEQFKLLSKAKQLWAQVNTLMGSAGWSFSVTKA